MSEYYSTQEAGKIMGLSANSIAKKIRAGLFPKSHKSEIANIWLMDKEEVDIISKEYNNNKVMKRSSSLGKL